MAYVALYRAYRPQKFADVVGQEHIIKTLQNAIRINKVAHAYLFCGPRGTGKTTLAKIMAKALNCTSGPAIEPCDHCEICEGIQKGTVPDVIEIDAASNNGADDIRSLRDSVKYLPSVGRYKVYIIDEVHMLSNAAFNALLKTLEEPPQHVVFILATTEPYKLPNTILSRCQRFDFQAISTEDILKRLKIVVEQEGIRVSEEALNQIAFSAEGGMRDALSLLDQCISYSLSEEIGLDDVLSISGNVSYRSFIDLLGACLDHNGSQALRQVDELLKKGKEVPRIINDLLLFLRDVLMFKNNAVLDDKKMFHEPDFTALANRLKYGVIYEWLDILNQTNNDMRFSNQKRAFLELAVLKMNDVKLQEEASFQERIEQLELLVSKLTSSKKEEPMVFPSVNKPTEVVPKIQNDEVSIEEIETILNTANKEKKTELSKIWKKIAEDYSGEFIVQILVAGELVAVSDTAFIVVLQDLGFCNRLMSYENYVRMMEIFSHYSQSFQEYICLPKAVWNKIKADYKAKYSASNPHPKLNALAIGVIKRKNPVSQSPVVQDKNRLYDYFDQDKIEILED